VNSFSCDLTAKRLTFMVVVLR